MLTPISFLEFQIEHYGERIANARSFEERIWLRKQLYNLKQQLLTWLN